MKWRNVKPKPWEFLWRTSVRGPFQPMPTPSLPGRVAIGGRGLSPAEEKPSLRPLACKHKEIWLKTIPQAGKAILYKKTAFLSFSKLEYMLLIRFTGIRNVSNISSFPLFAPTLEKNLQLSRFMAHWRSTRCLCTR